MATFEEIEREVNARLDREAAERRGLLAKEKFRQDLAYLVGMVVTFGAAAVTAGAAGPAVAAIVNSVPPSIMRMMQGAVTDLAKVIAAGGSAQDVASAIAADVLTQAGRYAAQIANTEALRKLKEQIPTNLDVRELEKFVTDRAVALASRDIPDQVSVIVKYQPIAEVVRRVKQSVILSQGTGLYDLELRRVVDGGMTPEALAKRFNVREDTAALALNALLGVYVYNSDWFDPVTGKMETGTAKLQAILADLRARGADEQSIEVVSSRLSNSPISELLARAMKRFRDPLEGEAKAKGFQNAQSYRDYLEWKPLAIARGLQYGAVAWDKFRFWLLGYSTFEEYKKNLARTLDAYKAQPNDPLAASIAAGLRPDLAPPKDQGAFLATAAVLVLTLPIWAPRVAPKLDALLSRIRR